MRYKLPLSYQDYWIEKEDKTLVDHAEKWWKRKGNKVPKRGTNEWKAMYQKWVDFAFEGWP